MVPGGEAGSGSGRVLQDISTELMRRERSSRDEGGRGGHRRGRRWNRARGVCGEGVVSGLPITSITSLLRKASLRQVTVFSQLPLSSGRLPEVLEGVFGIDGLVVRCPTHWARRELVHAILDCRLGVQLFGSARVAHLVGALSQLDEPYRLQANGTFAHAGPVHRASRSHRHRADR